MLWLRLFKNLRLLVFGQRSQALELRWDHFYYLANTDCRKRTATHMEHFLACEIVANWNLGFIFCRGHNVGQTFLNLGDHSLVRHYPSTWSFGSSSIFPKAPSISDQMMLEQQLSLGYLGLRFHLWFTCIIQILESSLEETSLKMHHREIQTCIYFSREHQLLNITFRMGYCCLAQPHDLKLNVF